MVLEGPRVSAVRLRGRVRTRGGHERCHHWEKVWSCRNSSGRRCHITGQHTPGQLMTEVQVGHLGCCSPLMPSSSLFLMGPSSHLTWRVSPEMDRVSGRAGPHVLAQFSVHVTISTSELGWEGFQAGGEPVTAFEAVSWRGPEARQRPSRLPGLPLDRGHQHQALQNLLYILAAPCSCSAEAPVPSGSIFPFLPLLHS